ncbi:molybdopterin-dependent oxidoreductase [Sphingomonas faeni]|uniref:molybdopterin-dependent oxidoreductase n=1 Tax=Sphingomonas faeni TaxID=185950 RepID=UPI00277F00EB|nr:molybdopterin-dependent oxidoreductase [Sphingomonas faeni]MDQ0839301.1 DMSO/TMAO reductase YedYZ molybdopterin-dependent catalytic subunit [Sphingomonas faeni]
MISRRTMIGGGAGLLLTGCDQVVQIPAARKILFSGERLNLATQRLLQVRAGGRAALAPEFTAADISPIFRGNGTQNPDTADYDALLANNFADYRLQVGGLVRTPLSLSLSQIMAMPARTQITRHDCVEGWSAIGKWHGPLLGTVLKAANIRPGARYVVCTCADMGGTYYDSVDLIDAFHPQSILAWGMNDQPLSVVHGAPIRLRVERQLGYKQSKYIMRIDVVDSLAGIGGGKGGYWEDNVDYEWYAGI